MIGLQQWRESASIFEYRGLPVFTRSGGNPAGAPLLLIHGFPTASWDWNKVWPALAESFQLYTLDMLGFGDSAKPRDFEYLISEQADLIETWLMQQGVRNFHILAHDYGDTVAQELLARDIERESAASKDASALSIQSVCFLNGGLFPETHRPALIQRLLLSPIGCLVGRLTSKRKFVENLQRIFGPDTPPSEEEINAFWNLLLANNGRNVLHKIIEYMPQREKNRERWVGALCDARVPLKLIDGVLDPISGAHMVVRYRELVSNPNITTLKRTGHYPQVEAPVEVLRAYMEFRKLIRT